MFAGGTQEPGAGGKLIKVGIVNLPPEESGKRYVALLGGADKAVAAAQAAFDRGDYRWTAECALQVLRQQLIAHFFQVYLERMPA